ncbi:trigger factor [Chthoniobacter flavus Ellin428]|uniref:Trigger factor n=1 Tax=Chthoniobacter flavus Ellin428 TaxID=497964 RepID=B4D1C3_9BACT|nr:trigger factor [Chthoniobacter flavus]EDY19535.1 trigger factor [Chthoniobacter flavus Ellin428]TCO92779.1 trigger factor [Chthoniobacter flavus]
MNVAVETLPNCITTLKVEVEPAKVAKVWDEVAGSYTKFARIPGYRAGKAPKAIIEKKFQKEIREELEKKLLSEACKEAIQEKGIKVLSLTQVDDIEIGEDKTMKFTATLITRPDFQLPVYKGIIVPLKSTDVTDEEVENSLNELREQAADFVDVTEDRGAQMEDFVVIDYTGTIDGAPVSDKFPKAGQPLSGNSDFWIHMVHEAFFPGFSEALVGAKVGETRKFDIEVPAEFPVEGLPGQKIQYEVTIKGIKQKTLPALDDAFADTIVKGKTLDELKKVAKEEIGRQKGAEAEATKRNEIMRHLLAQVECELPVDMVRTETRRILADIVRENQARGVTEDVLKQNEQEILGSAAQNARDRLKGTFVLLKIAEAENIKPTQQEFDQRIAYLAARYDMKPDKLIKKLDERNAIDQILEEVLTSKVLDFLAANASVSTIPAVVETPAQS